MKQTVKRPTEAGQMIIDLVDAGKMEWYQVARGDYMEQLMQHVESGVIADFDAAQLAKFDIDAEEIELMWNKL